MFRVFQRIAIFAASLFVVSEEASAQSLGFGYGFGYGHWGASTVEGDVDRGLGYLYLGLGQYNLNAATAYSIYTDTLIRQNQYLYDSGVNQGRIYQARIATDLKRGNDAYIANLGRLLDRPEPADIMRGGALNALVRKLSDQAVISSSAMRAMRVSMPGGTVEKAPLMLPSAGVMVSVGRMVVDGEWPILLRGVDFDTERAEYNRAIDKALETLTHGKLEPKAVADVDRAIERLGRNLAARNVTAQPSDAREAEDFLRRLFRATRSLHCKDAERVIEDLMSYGGTSVYDLVEFLSRSRLQFGPAETPEERDLYRDIHRLLAQQWDSLKPKTTMTR